MKMLKQKEDGNQLLKKFYRLCGHAFVISVCLIFGYPVKSSQYFILAGLAINGFGETAVQNVKKLFFPATESVANEWANASGEVKAECERAAAFYNGEAGRKIRRRLRRRRH